MATSVSSTAAPSDATTLEKEKPDIDAPAAARAPAAAIEQPAVKPEAGETNNAASSSSSTEENEEDYPKGINLVIVSIALCLSVFLVALVSKPLIPLESYSCAFSLSPSPFLPSGGSHCARCFWSPCTESDH